MPSRSRSTKAQTVQVLVVGDAATGKSALVETFVTSAFPEYSFPGAYNTWTHDAEIDGRRLNLSIWDAGSCTRPEHRVMSYPDKHVVLFCYDSSREATLVSVLEKWMPEVLHALPDAPFLLVSCKNDLRRDGRAKAASMTNLARSAHPHALLECSAQTATGVREVFELAARIGSEYAQIQSRPGRPTCRIQ